MTSPLKSFCFFCSYIEKNRFHDAVGLYSIVSQRMFSVFLPHFDVIFYLYYKTDARHYGISLISRCVFQSQDKRVILNHHHFCLPQEKTISIIYKFTVTFYRNLS